MHTKKERRCVSCKSCKQQNEMLRVARINNEYVIDNKQKLGGRGAYVCLNSACIQLAIKKRAFNRAFKTNIENNLYDQLGEYEQQD